MKSEEIAELPPSRAALRVLLKVTTTPRPIANLQRDRLKGKTSRIKNEKAHDFFQSFLLDAAGDTVHHRLALDRCSLLLLHELLHVLLLVMWRR